MITLDYITFLSQCNAREVRVAFPRGKRAATVRRNVFPGVHTISAPNAIASSSKCAAPNPSPYGLRKSALTGRCIWAVRAYRLRRFAVCSVFVFPYQRLWGPVADPVVAGSQPRPEPRFSPALKTRPQKAGLPMQTQFTLKQSKTNTTRNTKKFLATIY